MTSLFPVYQIALQSCAALAKPFRKKSREMILYEARPGKFGLQIVILQDGLDK
jgi:hypothetical protein